MILTAIFCLTLNPYMCSELQFVPEDYRAITSMGDCIMGGAIGTTTFIMEHQEYFVKGYRCQSRPPDTGAVAKWVEDEKARLDRIEPQIK